MKTIIVGGKDYFLASAEIAYLNDMKEQITEVVTNRTKGVAATAKAWAKRNNIPYTEFPLDWKKHRRKAGFIANAEMVEYADMIIAFPYDDLVKDILKLSYKKKMKVHNLTIISERRRKL